MLFRGTKETKNEAGRASEIEKEKKKRKVVFSPETLVYSGETLIDHG